MTLADYAQIADGKLFISGGGWSMCGPGPTPCAVVAIFHVPWQETDQKVSFALRLIDEDDFERLVSRARHLRGDFVRCAGG